MSSRGPHRRASAWRRTSASLIACGALLAAGELRAGDQDYRCYKAKELKKVCAGSLERCKADGDCASGRCLSGFGKRTLELSDAIEGATSAAVKRPRSICAAVERDYDGDPPRVQMARYPVKQKSRLGQTLLVRNRYGDQLLQLRKVDSLLVPTAMSMQGEPAPLAPDADHYKCYAVKELKKRCIDAPDVKCKDDSGCPAGGTCYLGLASPPTSKLADDLSVLLEDAAPGKPQLLCSPADVGEPIVDPVEHLVGYQLEGGQGKVEAIRIENRFGPDALDATRTELLLAPSLVSPAAAATCRDGVLNGPEECDFPDDAACPGRCLADCTCADPPPRTLRALAVVADFADQELEDYRGDPDAIRSVQDLRPLLDAMSDHWRWMSVETERMEWDVIRIRLDQKLTPDAYTGWSHYRSAVIHHALAQVDVPVYDSDSDGVLDVMFVVASAGDAGFAYLAGGASHTGSARGSAGIFVDGQTSRSVRQRVIGNLNHECGHLWGLTDLYGSHSNVGFTTLMGGESWARPPFGFSAWDRQRLGWLVPRRIETTTGGVVLYPAEENLESVLIPTADPEEYFVLEYRRKPPDGYGTATAEDYDGLAIYHIWEPGRNRAEPPQMRVEPVDGIIDYDAPLEAEDFWYPGNPRTTGGFEGRSYSDPDTPLFEVANFAYTHDGGLSFDVEFPPAP